MARVMTLGRVAYEQHQKNTGNTSAWEMRFMTQAREGWERIGQAVRQAVVAELASSGYEHSAATKRARRELGKDAQFTGFGQERRPRQGGMVNVHTKPPMHYNAHPSGVECIEVTRHMPFNLGNVVKYLWRAGLKENESEIKDLEKALDYLHDEIEKRKLALGVSEPPKPGAPFFSREDLEKVLTPEQLRTAYRWESVPDQRLKDGPLAELERRAFVVEPPRTDNSNPNARCKSHQCEGRTRYDAQTGGANAFVRMPYYYCLACLVRMGELNTDGSHKLASGDR